MTASLGDLAVACVHVGRARNPRNGCRAVPVHGYSIEIKPLPVAVATNPVVPSMLVAVAIPSMLPPRWTQKSTTSAMADQLPPAANALPSRSNGTPFRISSGPVPKPDWQSVYGNLGPSARCPSFLGLCERSFARDHSAGPPNRHRLGPDKTGIYRAGAHAGGAPGCRSAFIPPYGRLSSTDIVTKPQPLSRSCRPSRPETTSALTGRLRYAWIDRGTGLTAAASSSARNTMQPGCRNPRCGR